MMMNGMSGKRESKANSSLEARARVGVGDGFMG